MWLFAYLEKSLEPDHTAVTAQKASTGEPVRLRLGKFAPVAVKADLSPLAPVLSPGNSSTGLAGGAGRGSTAAARADDGQRRDVKYPASERARRGGESASRGGTRRPRPRLARDAARENFAGPAKSDLRRGVGRCASRGEDGDARPRGARPRVGRARRRGREGGPSSASRARGRGRHDPKRRIRPRAES